MSVSADTREPTVQEIPGWQVKDGRVQECSVKTVVEEPLTVEINDRQVAVLMRLPGMEKELAIGFCITEGLIPGFDQVLGVRHCGEDNPESERTDEPRNRVSVRVPPAIAASMQTGDAVRLIRASCGAVQIDEGDLDLPVLPDGFAVDAAVLPALPKIMQEAQYLRHQVGGVHAVAVFDAKGEPVSVCEDIGRHNAADKVIGHCLLHDIPLRDKILLSSGRLSYEMVSKAVRAGIPVVASVSAPTSLAVRLAQRCNACLVGYLRGSRYTVYAHPERLTTP